MPAVVNAGNTLVAFIRPNGCDDNPPSGWTPVQFGNNDHRMFTKAADGSEGGTQVTFVFDTPGFVTQFAAVVGCYDMDPTGGSALGDGTPNGVGNGEAGSGLTASIDGGLNEYQAIFPEGWQSVISSASVTDVGATAQFPTSRTGHNGAEVRAFVQFESGSGASLVRRESVLADHLNWTDPGSDDSFGVTWTYPPGASPSGNFILPRAFQRETALVQPTEGGGLALRLVRVRASDLPYQLHTRML